MDTPNHPLWIMFIRQYINSNKHPRVFTYINIRIIHLWFSLRKNLINHKDINLIFFFNRNIICFIFNVYLDDQQTVLKYLKNREVNLNNVLIMIRNFNIRNNNWDFAYPYYSIYTDTLGKVTDSFNLELSTSII